MGRLAAFAFVLLSLCSAASVRAQDASAPLTARSVGVPAAVLMDFSREQEVELRRWLDAMEKWRRRYDGSENHVAHGISGNIVPRHLPPPAPDWLSASCKPFGDHPVVLTGEFGAGCQLLAVLTADVTAEALQRSTQAARTSQEKTDRSSFFSRLHLDGLWVNPSTDGRAYGLLGSHISLVDVGRVQMFGPPGVLLLRVPTGSGSYETRVGYTWGISVRLTDVRLFAPSRNLTLFVSLTKCWIAGGATSALTSPTLDLVGFSLAPRKQPH